MRTLQLVKLSAAFIVLQWAVAACSIADTGIAKAANRPTDSGGHADLAPVEAAKIMSLVRSTYEMPTQSFLCRDGSAPLRAIVRRRLGGIFSDEILDKFVSRKPLCDVLASARFGFDPLDTPEAINRAYSAAYSAPFVMGSETLVEVRFRPIAGGPAEAEGGAIVYLKKLKAGWRIVNIESVGQLGSNGFQSLVQDYPTVSGDAWSDMDYTKSLASPTPLRQ